MHRRIWWSSLVASVGLAVSHAGSAAAGGEADAVAVARAAIERAIRAHGQGPLGQCRVDFSFRGTRYRMTRDRGRFRYERWVSTPRGTLHEVLDNDGFRATLSDGTSVALTSAQAASRRRSLNSVVYFASLPYALTDPAVRPRALKPTVIEGRPHETIEVRFAENGGGDDHDDVFRYWFDRETGRMRYLAYSFRTGGGGVRFRMATGYPEAKGLTFVRWDNYGIDDPSIPLASLPDRWAAGALPLLSKIPIDDISARCEPAQPARSGRRD